MSDFKSKLDKAAQIHTDMMLLINICKSGTGSLDYMGVDLSAPIDLPSLTSSDENTSMSLAGAMSGTIN